MALIDYIAVEEGYNSVRVIIAHQHAINDKFNCNTDKDLFAFEASNGFMLISDLEPAYYGSHCSLPNMVYLRGSNRDNDNEPIHMPKEVFRLFKEAVDEYNSTYGSGITDF